MSDISKKEAIKQLWEQGVVCEWLLDDNQKSVYELYKKSPKSSKVVVVYPRQCGKSFGSFAMAIELCLNKNNFHVLFVAPRQNQAKRIATETAREILDTCPPDLRPEFKTQDKEFLFHNGSKIKVIGNNAGRIEGARGGKAHLIICDEVGFWDDLAYSVRSVLTPMLNTTKGKLLMISTPPRSAGHPFQKFHDEAVFKKLAVKKTIYDCPRYTKEDIDRFAEEAGGYDSVDFRREYLCEFIVDSSMAVIPEATIHHMENIVKEWERPAYFDAYVAMDIGFKDLTAVLFAYYDFRQGKVVIEDELILNTPEQLRTDNFAYSLHDKEQELWGDPFSAEAYEPYLRVSDINHFLLNDLYLQHGLVVQPTAKDDFDGGINNMRMMIGSQKLIIHPRCKSLIFHIQNATWKNEKRKDFDRSPDAGHYDCVAALMYLLRNIQYSKNPYPTDFDLNLNSNSFVSPHWKGNTSNIRENLSDIFKLKSTMKKRR